MIIAIGCAAAFLAVTAFLIYLGRFAQRGVVWVKDE
jgi:hypothetical protein